MGTSRALAAVLAIGLLLLTVSAALAAPDTSHDDTTTDTANDDVSTSGTMNAVLSSASATGRVILSVGAVDAQTVTGTGSTVLDAGTPAEIIVEETLADGVADWYVAAYLTDDLSNSNGDTYASSNVTAAINSTVGVNTVRLDTADSTAVKAVEYATDDATGLDTGSALFVVENQSSGTSYSATYTAGADFIVDASNYTGTLDAFTAPYTITIHQ